MKNKVNMLSFKHLVLFITFLSLSFYAGFKYSLIRDPRTINSPRSIPGCLSEPTSIDGVKTYRNGTYNIEFQYDEDSKISFERINGVQYLSGALVGKKIPVDHPSNVLTIKSSDLEFVESIVDGAAVNFNDTNYFDMAFGDDSKLGVCRHYDNFETKSNSKGLSYKWMILKDHKPFMKNGEELTTYTACFEQGNRVWSLSASPKYSKNKDEILRLFNIIIDSFAFTN